MTGYARWEAYVDAVRRIVLLSPDVLPEEIATYLKEVARSGDWSRTTKVLAASGALMRTMPADLADFALEAIPEDIPSGGRSSPLEINGLGFQGRFDYFPASHVQGPFLGLLRADEDNGLRLVNGLVNLAVRRWRILQEARGATPLPQAVDQPTGPRELWGDQSVYYWFRTRGTAPTLIGCALMALEVWMEEQIRAHRAAEGLFTRVVGDSDCVATAGICLGLAMEFPAACMSAAVPFVATPGLWMMDLARSVTDQGASLQIVSRTSVLAEKANAERDSQAHRRLSIRDLAPHMMVYGGDSIRAALDEAASRFTADLPFQYEEEKHDSEWAANLREKMENFQAECTAANYRQTVTADGREAVVFEPPAELLARSVAYRERNADYTLALKLYGWSQRMLGESGAAPGPDVLAEAVADAQRLQRPDDYEAPVIIDDDGEGFRLRGVAGTATTVLVRGGEWAWETGTASWCRQTLLAAARTPYPPAGNDSRYALALGDEKTSAAHGLAAIAARGRADSEVRSALLTLMVDTRQRVPAAVMQGLTDVWDVDPVLCWNALALGISLAKVPFRLAYGPIPSDDEQGWRAGLLNEAVRRTEAREVSSLPGIPDQEKDGGYLAWNLLEQLLSALPVARLARDEKAKTKLLGLLDDLMRWTLRQNLPHSRGNRVVEAHPPYEWNTSFSDWIAAVGKALAPDEVSKHILEPVRDVFDEAPGLTADLMKGYINHHLGFMYPPSADSVAQWKEITRWVLASEPVRRAAGDRHMGHDLAQAVTLPVFSWEYGECFKAEWPHAPIFADVIGEWVETIGTNAYAFACLLTTLSGAGWVFAPNPALAWLSDCLKRTPLADAILQEHGNSDRLASFLQRVWHEHRETVVEQVAVRAAYADVIDRLVAYGTPLAGVLQRQLEADVRGRRT